MGYIKQNFKDGETLKASQLNYLELDETVVEDIIVTLSELESINFLGHVGANLGIKTLVGDNEE